MAQDGVIHLESYQGAASTWSPKGSNLFKEAHLMHWLVFYTERHHRVTEGS